jgi:hypothetical protein
MLAANVHTATNATAAIARHIAGPPAKSDDEFGVDLRCDPCGFIQEGEERIAERWQSPAIDSSRRSRRP